MQPSPQDFRDQSWRDHQPKSDCNDIRLLLADDSVAVRSLLAALLRRMSIKVDVAQNGEEVVELFHKFEYDLIMLDLDMPVMDGITAARQIRQAQGVGHAIPILAISGCLAVAASAPDRQQLFDGALTKPITLSGLRNAIIRILPAGRVLAERSAMPQTMSVDLPLINFAAWHTAQPKTDLAVPLERLASHFSSKLRGLSMLLKESSTVGDRENLKRAALDLQRLGTQIHADRLARRASTLIAMAELEPVEALQPRINEVIGCVAATLNELRKVAGTGQPLVGSAILRGAGATDIRPLKAATSARVL